MFALPTPELCTVTKLGFSLGGICMGWKVPFCKVTLTACCKAGLTALIKESCAKTSNIEGLSSDDAVVKCAPCSAMTGEFTCLRTCVRG